jgi:hypothetical protein
MGRSRRYDPLRLNDSKVGKQGAYICMFVGYPDNYGYDMWDPRILSVHITQDIK